MKKSQLRRIIREEMQRFEDDGSIYHINQIDDDLQEGDFQNQREISAYLDNIIRGIEGLREKYRGFDHIPN